MKVEHHIATMAQGWKIIKSGDFFQLIDPNGKTQATRNSLDECRADFHRLTGL